MYLFFAENAALTAFYFQSLSARSNQSQMGGFVGGIGEIKRRWTRDSTR